MSESPEQKRRLSCTEHFEALLLSHSPLDQMQHKNYRFGCLENRYRKWYSFFDCLMLKTKPNSQVEEILEARQKAKSHI